MRVVNEKNEEKQVHELASIALNNRLIFRSILWSFELFSLPPFLF